MALIIKISNDTYNTNNIISLPPNSTSHDVLNYNNYLISYNQLADTETPTERDLFKRFLTTDCMTDTYTETSKNKILSCYGFNNYKNYLNDFLNSAINSYLGYITSVYKLDPGTSDDTIYTMFNETKFTLTSNISTVGANFIEISNTPITALTNFTEFGGTDVRVLKILAPGIFRINYEIYSSATPGSTVGVKAGGMTSMMRLYRVIEDNGEASHHNKVIEDIDYVDAVTEENNQSYLIGHTEGNHATVYDSGIDADNFVNCQKGSSTIFYNPPTGIQEYILIGFGVDADLTGATTNGAFIQLPIIRITIELVQAL